MRVFIAALLPDEVKDYIGSYVDLVKPLWEGVRWERPEKYHITLKFLGEIQRSSLEGVLSIVEASSKKPAAFDMSLDRMGGFPNLKKPRVIYMGMKDNIALSAFGEEIEGQLEPLGYPREKRPFTPHATVGRVRGRARAADNLPDVESLDFSISDIGVIESVLSTGGSRYAPLGVFKV